ncbi:MAG: arginine N-succinyltransferase [Desulfobulbaceae bacterium]|nr:arginine N-succinyltransferase [Desulfobulbaceae bacterium]
MKVKKSGFSAMQVLGMVVGSMLLTLVVTVVTIKMFLFPPPFKPVTLSEKEESVLTAKLETFEGFGGAPARKPTTEYNSDGSLKPEKYSEQGSSREINFTERELNAMVAKNTDLADKVALDLAQDMISIKLLIPMDPDFPMLGGKTLKVKAGAELAYRNGRPVVKLQGVSLMGVPMPNAWLGGIKNIDLIDEFGKDEGFWKSFADGVKSIGVVEGLLKIELKE